MRTQRLKRQEAFEGFAFVLPAIVLLVVFGFIPIILAGWISLYDFPLLNPARREFIGAGNYLRALQDRTVQRAFVNTIYYALWQMPMQTILGLFLALLVQRPLRGIGIFRTVYYLPVVISMVVASVLWRVMLDSQNGLINAFLVTFGISRQPLLTSPWQALPSLAVMLSWKWVGFSMLIFLAGLQGIPSEIYEAAAIDGATALKRFWYVTLPLLRRPALYVLVANTVNALKLFTPIYIITQGGPQDSTLVMIYYIFREAFRFNRLGYGAAVAVLFTIFLIALAVFQLRVLRSEAE
ncbi:MAG: sugar ABC transporter permease [Ardenticatenaceae bacterium]|nr:sugar ABC transporter permease [Ardenticatenaceae bacterium]HBY94266.1 sugar ABC transporter permease [Chloroflexota bacterium]